MDAGRQFRDADARTRRLYETYYVVAGALFFTLTVAGKLVAGATYNWTSAVASGSGALMHFGMVLYRCRYPEAWWLPAIVCWLDCAMATFGHVAVQRAFWDSIYSPLSLGEIPYNNVLREVQYPGKCAMYYEKCSLGCMVASGIQSTLMLCTILSYMTNFVLLFRQGLLLNAVGIPVYLSVVLYSRLSIPNIDPQLTSLGVEAFCLLLTTIFSLSAKRHSERLSLQMVEMLTKETKEKFSEKALRCEAEFAMENLKDTIAGARPQSDAPSGVDVLSSIGDHTESSGQPASQRAPSSAKSAPAKLFSFLVDAQAMGPGTRSCAEADCLPMDATVWAEGLGRPILLGSVAAGQRILAYDSLSEDVRYAEVLRIQKLAEPAGWLRVALADGTELRVTPDHQVKLADASSTKLGGYTQAQDLRPGSSAVMVHKVVMKPVLVEDVQIEVARPDAVEPGRISVEIHHPEQYSILCAAPAVGAGGGERRRAGPHVNVRAVAVGSANLIECRLSEKNLFAEVLEPKDMLPFRRCVSEPGDVAAQSRPEVVLPPLLAAEPATWGPVAVPNTVVLSPPQLPEAFVPSPPRSERSMAFEEPLDIFATVAPAGASNAPLDIAADVASAGVSSSAMAAPSFGVRSEGSAGAPGYATLAPGAGVDSEEAVAGGLGEPAPWPRNVGSALHGTGRCRVCFNPQGCRYGVDCTYCHHPDHRVKRIRGKRCYA